MKYWQWLLPKRALKSDKKTGLSLLEVLVVLALIAIITVYSIPKLNFQKKEFVKFEMEKLYNICLHLRHVAMMENEPQQLLFDISKNMYSFKQSKENISKNVRFGVAKDVKGPPSGFSEKILDPITFEKKTIVFYPDGKISSGIVYFTDLDQEVSFALSCAVAKVSFLRKYKFDGNWKLIS
ncbi:MAG: hypothetical protein UR26_C0002G0185 [candidate division TM6 bacterium GW2011_GWF2_32_72]|nr:MAG: hypothetical protein UR26_C0002G0185 [candidate division TM6 bacterium GW2011_GWF2_32_72]